MATLNVPNPAPSAYEDAEQLRKACEGWGTNDKEVINVLAHRDATQRAQIKQAYEERYKESLTKRLESELTGHFEKAVYRWMFNPVERAAVMANVALKKDVDYQVLIEIACTNSPNELLAVKHVYHDRYKRSLEEDVASHTVGDFRKLLVGLVGVYRYSGDEINPSLAQQEAKILHEAIKERCFTHDEIIRILSTRSKAQLNATFNCYKDEHGISVTKALATETKNEFVFALQTAIRCIVNPQKYFVKVLRQAINRSGADEDALTRVIVMHAEKDLKEIKEIFQKRTNVTLEDAVAKETSGDYKKFLLALMGN